MAGEKRADFLNVTVSEGQSGHPELLDDEARRAVFEVVGTPLAKASSLAQRYVPPDPAHAWRDFQVQRGTRRYLTEVVLPWWVKNHTHRPCSNIRVDDWGRLLCRYITPTNGVDGPWENPTHFVFYAYNNFQTQQTIGIRHKPFLAEYCNIYVD